MSLVSVASRAWWLARVKALCAQVPVVVTATVMAPSKGTPALKPDVYLVDLSAEADTDLES